MTPAETWTTSPAVPCGLIIRVGATFAVLTALIFLSGGTAFGATGVGAIADTDPETAGNSDVFGADWRIPFDGVITSWQVRGSDNSGDAGSSGSLRVWRRVDDGSPPVRAQLVAESESQDVRPGVNSFLTRLAVRAGDRLGLSSYYLGGSYSRAGSTVCGTEYGSAGAPGAEAAFECGGELAANVAATLEPDGDGDGFGDESQDKCPGAGGTDDGCVAIAPLSLSEARGYLRRVLRKKYRSRFTTRRHYRRSCKRASKAKVRCRVRWDSGRWRYSGAVTLRNDPNDPENAIVYTTSIRRKHRAVGSRA